MPNILDSIKGAGLSSVLFLIETLYPASKPIIEQIQQDIADGKITEENFESTFDKFVDLAENFTDDEWDAILEQSKKVAHESIVLEEMIKAKSK